MLAACGDDDASDDDDDYTGIEPCEGAACSDQCPCNCPPGYVGSNGMGVICECSDALCAEVEDGYVCQDNEGAPPAMFGPRMFGICGAPGTVDASTDAAPDSGE